MLSRWKILVNTSGSMVIPGIDVVSTVVGREDVIAIPKPILDVEFAWRMQPVPRSEPC
jgi:hypothetical protein